jgi:hypothetical protein
MNVFRTAFASVISLSLVLVTMPTTAQTYPPIVLKQLGRYPVVPSVSSTARLRAHRRALLAAAKTIPLTQGEYDALDAELRDPKVLQYGLIPRHLDAMTSGPAPFHALHNVTIPPKQYGWHLTYSHGVHRTDIYIPNACGNVSVVRSIEKAQTRRARSPLPTPAYSPLAQPSELPPTASPVPLASPQSTPAATPTPKKKTFLARYWPVLAGIVALCVTQTRIGNFRLCSFGGHGSHNSPAPKPSASFQPGPPPHSPTPAPTMSSQPGPPPHTPTPSPTQTPNSTPTPMPSWTPMPTPTPTSCPLTVSLKNILKAWGGLSSPKDWKSVHFDFRLPL